MRAFTASLLLSSVALFIVVGCSGRSTTPTSDGSSSAIIAGQNACANKACGADCSPPGSDEPFNCNAAGECVAAGADLACNPSPECAGKVCGANCSAPDSDEPFACNSAGKCVYAGDALGCKQCPEFLGDCEAGTTPGDLDGDGCIDGCKQCPDVLGDCQAGTAPADRDGDGCIDGCR